MRALLILVVAILGLLVTVDRQDTRTRVAPRTETTESSTAFSLIDLRKAASSIAAYPDRGQLLAYDSERHVVRSGASTWHPVQISEAYALRAIAEGGMTIPAPNGELIRLRYERHFEHPDGNWTWVGRAEGSAPGTETILTFGEKAVFGRIRQGGANLSLTTEAGSTWLVATDYNRVDPNRLAVTDDDFQIPAGMANLKAASVPELTRSVSGSVKQVASMSAAAQATASAVTTVDVAIGFTTGFATRLGGESQARTRLNFLVDLTNEAYLASGINAQIRLVHALQVDYADATHSRTALFDLTGVDCTQQTNGAHYMSSTRWDCTPVTQSAGLQPLTAARNTYGADLLVLIRKFEAPEQASCGTAWLLGGGQTGFDSSSAAYAMTVVSDSSGDTFPDEGTTCPEIHMAHELGHLMGQQHDLVTAMGSDDSDNNGSLLDPEEFGYHPYSFSYSTDGTASDIATIMSNRRSTQTRYHVFANPLISSCGGAPCGIADQADNARSMNITMPLVSAFRATVVGKVRNDFNGDGKSDIYWRNLSDGRTAIWTMNGLAITQMAIVFQESDQHWQVAALNDFDGDGHADVLWRNGTTGENYLQFMNGNQVLPQSTALTPVSDLTWKIAAVADFNGDGKADIYWRNTSHGTTAMWLMNGAAIGSSSYVYREQDQQWQIVGAADFNADARADLFWRNSATGQNYVQFMDGATILPGSQATTTVGDLSWKIVALDDFNGDGKADLYWRNTQHGRNVIWFMNAATLTSIQTVSVEADQNWRVVNSGDYNGDGRADILWRNFSSGRNYLHLMSGATIASGAETFQVRELEWTVTGH